VIGQWWRGTVCIPGRKSLKTPEEQLGGRARAECKLWQSPISLGREGRPRGLGRPKEGRTQGLGEVLVTRSSSGNGQALVTHGHRARGLAEGSKVFNNLHYWTNTKLHSGHHGQLILEFTTSCHMPGFSKVDGVGGAYRFRLAAQPPEGGWSELQWAAFRNGERTRTLARVPTSREWLAKVETRGAETRFICIYLKRRVSMLLGSGVVH